MLILTNDPWANLILMLLLMWCLDTVHNYLLTTWVGDWSWAIFIVVLMNLYEPVLQVWEALPLD